MNDMAPGAPSAAGVPSPADSAPGSTPSGGAAAADAPLQVTRALLRTLPVLSLLTEEQLAQVVASARVSRFPWMHAIGDMESYLVCSKKPTSMPRLDVV